MGFRWKLMILMFRIAMWWWVQTSIILDEVSASFKNCLIIKPLMYKPTSPSNLVLAVSKNNFDDKLVCWKADRAKNLEVSNMPYLHKLVNSPQSLFEKLETNVQQVQLKALLLFQLTQVFWPAYHNSWTIFNTVVCLSKHISKCHLNEILDKSVIICADKRWTSTF